MSNLYEALVPADDLLIGSRRLSLGTAREVLAPYRWRTVIAGTRPEHLEPDDDERAGHAGNATGDRRSGRAVPGEPRPPGV